MREFPGESLPEEREKRFQRLAKMRAAWFTGVVKVGQGRSNQNACGRLPNLLFAAAGIRLIRRVRQADGSSPHAMARHRGQSRQPGICDFVLPTQLRFQDSDAAGEQMSDG